MKTLIALAFALFAATAHAEGTHSADHGDMQMSHGTITKIDTKWNKLTIDHGPLENLGMDAMTMVFEVTDPVMIEGLAEGQEVDFVADRVKGKLTVTEIMTE
ncbi:copper-binding protein [Pseudooceanicola spongiae]|uniref:RND transporter n=1 Tax=Pseudooceanicola spongiae TaxID=2613965 RepID=A0A7L9WR99_9RHOB|nr:copper-binding protein [Pseudooceanicola spongiae]QOL82809.1 RND transporter [Pseudooceanicola spongiae]